MNQVGPGDETLLTVAEAAQRLRMSPRTLYHLVSKARIPFLRAGGRLLFEPQRLEAWLSVSASHTATVETTPVESIIAGSHDPLLEWAVRASGADLALACHGSSDGLTRLASRRACAALVHLPDSRSDGFNTEAIQRALGGLPVVSLHWACREQGLIVAPGNPLRIKGPRDLASRRVRVIRRQPGAGSNLLFARLMREAGIPMERLRVIDAVAQNENEVAEAILDGHADTGLAIGLVAERYRLPFIRLASEAVELVAWRRSVFEPPLQALIRFAQSRKFQLHARRLAGYDLSGHGSVRYNG